MNTRRKFSSYGPVNTETEYFVPRTDLVNRAIQQLVGEKNEAGGHYFTVWAPRQSGKTWILGQALYRLQKDERFIVAKLNIDSFQSITNFIELANRLLIAIGDKLNISFLPIVNEDDFINSFKKKYLPKPLILIIDEFDVISEPLINSIVRLFRQMYISRLEENQQKAEEKTYLLHGLALIGVRSVLGIDNKKGSPFNIQKSIHIPNLTFEEVKQMYDDYQREWEQKIEPEVVERLFYETNGQPGLVSWFGELMVEKYNKEYTNTIEMKQWKKVFLMGSQAEPNNTIMNLISKARQPEYKELLTELFDTNEKSEFSFDSPEMNYLYMNGIIQFEHSEEESGTLYAKFSSPFVQKRLFNRFANELYPHMGQIIKPFENINHIYNGETINVKNMLIRFERYLRENSEWLLKDAPRRKSDMQIYEATYQFILYGWLSRFLNQLASVTPEFPTGNGKIDLLIRKDTYLYGIEVKSFTDIYLMQKGIKQAATYATQLKLSEITLAIFITSLDADTRAEHEKEYIDETTGVKVYTQFISINE